MSKETQKSIEELDLEKEQNHEKLREGQSTDSKVSDNSNQQPPKTGLGGAISGGPL